MNTRVRKHISLANILDADVLDTLAVAKDQDYDSETTWWIFEDNSALGINSHNKVITKLQYGSITDCEKLVNY